MKDFTITINDVENGFVVKAVKVVPDRAEGADGAAGWIRGFAQQGAQRVIVCKSWQEVLATLAAMEPVRA